MIRLAVYVAIEAAVAAMLLLAAGTDLAHTLMAFLAAVAVTVFVVGQPEPRSPRWPRSEVSVKDGARDDVSTLSWTLLSKDDAVSPRAVRAVRATASTRLRLLGVDLDDPADAPAARRLLGDETYAFVGSSLDKPTLPHLLRAIDRLTEIDPAGTAPPRST